MGQSDPSRIYLDHAATSWPKPAEVIRAATDFIVNSGASAGRGGYRRAIDAQRHVTGLRRQLANQVNVRRDDCITIHSGCTAALNIAIHGLIPSAAPGGPHAGGGIVGPGDHVLATAAEHNAVLRPLQVATRRVGARLEVIDCDRNGRVDPADLRAAVTPATKLVAVTFASNVTGCIQPIGDIAEALNGPNRQRDPGDRIRLLCDAAQGFGYLPIDVDRLSIDILAAPAHKGSEGLPGAAMLYLHPDLHTLIQPPFQGGTGHDGRDWEMPAQMPGRLEPGTWNLPAIAAWQAALTQHAKSADGSADKLRHLASRLRSGLKRIPDCEVYGCTDALPIASFRLKSGLPPDEIAAILDVEFGIEVRAGYHCAAAIHRCLGTSEGGTVRISAGHTTTADQIDAAVDAVAEIAAHCTSSGHDSSR